MLSYETAVKLKDAGFPLTRCSDSYECDREQFCQLDGFKGDVMQEDLHVPTLSELIEACGDELGSICKEVGIAHSGKECFTGCWHAVGQSTKTSGSSPEEAVANLWLKLNSKEE